MSERIPLMFVKTLGKILLLVLLGGGLVSCGSNGGIGGATTPGASPAASPTTPAGQTATATPGKSPAGTAKTPAIAPEMQQCGTIAVNPHSQLEDAGLSQKTGNCFWQAYQKCQAASFVFNVGGLDTLTKRVFTIQKSASGCFVSDTVQHSIAPRPATSSQTYTCAGVTKTGGELVFQACGKDGNVSVPIAGM